MVKWLRRLVSGDDDEGDELLSPNCELLVRTYDFDDGAILAVQVDVDEGLVVLEMDLPVFENHPAYSTLHEVRREVTATFHGVFEPSATLRGEPLPRGPKVDLEYELQIDELYVSATCPWAYRETSYHAHVFWCLAEGLVLAFPFTDVRCKERLQD